MHRSFSHTHTLDIGLIIIAGGSHMLCGGITRSLTTRVLSSLTDVRGGRPAGLLIHSVCSEIHGGLWYH